MAKSFVKIWTDILDDDWFLELNLNQKGAWILLLIFAKLRGDTGHFCYKSVATLSELWGCDDRTATKLHRHFESCGKIVVEKRKRSTALTIPKYEYWQQVKATGKGEALVQKCSKSAAKVQHDYIPPDQTIKKDQTRPDHSNKEPHNKNYEDGGPSDTKQEKSSRPQDLGINAVTKILIGKGLLPNKETVRLAAWFCASYRRIRGELWDLPDALEQLARQELATAQTDTEVRRYCKTLHECLDPNSENKDWLPPRMEQAAEAVKAAQRVEAKGQQEHIGGGKC